MNRESFAKKYPTIMSLIYVIILSIFSVVATIISIAFNLSKYSTMLIQMCSFFLSALVGIALMTKSGYTLKEYGFLINYKIGTLGILGLFPIIIAEGITFIVGINWDITYIDAILTLLFMLAAVINEELYFRGLILRALSVKGIRFAIIFSSILFGLVHLGSLTIGKGISHTILLVVVSALFAFVSAEIIVLTGSLIIPIIWHFIRNLISSITLEASSSMTLMIVTIQCVFLLAYAIFLWIEIKRKGLMTISSSNNLNNIGR